MIEDIDMIEFFFIETVEYITALDVNSNGQILEWDRGDEVTDLDVEQLVASSLAMSTNFEYFKWYCTRHDNLFNETSVIDRNGRMFGGFVFVVAGGLLLYNTLNFKRMNILHNVAFSVIFLLLIILGIWLTLSESLKYYFNLMKV
ncbi:p74 [Spodoptera litura granulovirus]|uniref:P74 n=1 Tax=Spodoptera litura granulovirus TaxID=359919 RepID=A5IZQ8_9BBAC|nr:p74 [Spodoptera litura granulovirus]ABQ51999.1 p74 [Spodoptera litura granulovirus]